MSSNGSEVVALRESHDSFTVGDCFEEICTTYDSDALRYFLDGAIALIDELDMTAVESVLDVGTGTGHTALEVAKRYPHCRIVGADSSPGMLGVAELKKGNMRNVTFLKHDWEELEHLRGEYDLVTNSWGACFIANFDKFAKSVASKVKPDGVFAFVNFADGSFGQFGVEFASNLAEMSLWKQPPPFAQANGELIRFMKGNGFETLRIIHKQFEYAVKDAEQWWMVVWGTAMKNLLHHLAQSELEAFRLMHLNRVQRLIDSGYNKLVVATLIVIVRAPSRSSL